MVLHLLSRGHAHGNANDDALPLTGAIRFSSNVKASQCVCISLTWYAHQPPAVLDMLQDRECLSCCSYQSAWLPESQPQEQLALLRAAEVPPTTAIIRPVVMKG